MEAGPASAAPPTDNGPLLQVAGQPTDWGETPTNGTTPNRWAWVRISNPHATHRTSRPLGTLTASISARLTQLLR